MDWKDAPSYFRYWGKAKPAEADKGDSPCHLLPFHSLDVAAVGYYLLAPDTTRCRDLAAQSGLEPVQLQSLFVFSLLLHDLGKFARAFQSLAEPALMDLVRPDSSLAYNTREWPHHSEAGAVFLKAFFKDELKKEGMGNWGWSSAVTGAKPFLRALLGMAFGHHGQPVKAGDFPYSSPGYPEDQRAAWEYSCEVARYFKPQWPEIQVQDKDWVKEFKRLTWHLAGLAVLADWLGSDQTVFTYQAWPEPLEDYWQQKALPRATRVLEKVGFGQTPCPVPFPGVKAFFGFTPTPLQRWAQDLEWQSGPQLFVLEDVTGAGKTEAAMTLVHRLLENGQAHGVYFGLPTMATSNAMYGRLADVYGKWFDSQKPPNLVLAHGARHLNPRFTRSVVPEQVRDHPYGASEDTASEACNQWFADSRKKALLADVGVGTVDQVLMAVLPFKHQTLRLAGLAGKVLVVDEVHACDDYMARLLEAVLEAHARQGGSAILLTATLPHALRQSLVSAYQRGRGKVVGALQPCPAFPLASRVTDSTIEQTALETRPSVVRRVAVEPLEQQEEAIRYLLSGAEEGQCACWIRNTVDDAITAYQLLRERAREPDKVMLFHSRFVMADRQTIEQAALDRFGGRSLAEDRAGWILVATQVVEQSLDLDFDRMISDLAPMDLLIQRAGRLHRHCRDHNGNPIEGKDQREAPMLRVLAPAFEDQPATDWLSRRLPGTGAVYRDHGLLWLTLKTLLEEGGIQMPERARHLIESVFSEEAKAVIPEGLQSRHLDQEGERRSHRAMANFNLLDMAKGYDLGAGPGGTGEWAKDLEIGTRLNEEPSVTVTLVRWDERRQQILPWVKEEDFPWELSQLQVRESLARRLPEIPEELNVAREMLLEHRPGLKFTRLWLAEVGGETMDYDAHLGLHRTGDRS
ncbi:MAG: CRISPR-associated helicase Cas3' [Alcanivorax sp.]|nr:CRISPR-associated helicase Cas3' [Alcanivorax sp.]